MLSRSFETFKVVVWWMTVIRALITMGFHWHFNPDTSSHDCWKRKTSTRFEIRKRKPIECLCLLCHKIFTSILLKFGFKFSIRGLTSEWWAIPKSRCHLVLIHFLFMFSTPRGPLESDFISHIVSRTTRFQTSTCHIDCLIKKLRFCNRAELIVFVLHVRVISFDGVVKILLPVWPHWLWLAGLSRF